MTRDQFMDLVRRHDITYMYSDDHRAYLAGQASMDAIQAAAKDLDPALVATIWNAEVDRKIAVDYREEWYWHLEEAQQ